MHIMLMLFNVVIVVNLMQHLFFILSSTRLLQYKMVYQWWTVYYFS